MKEIAEKGESFEVSGLSKQMREKYLALDSQIIYSECQELSKACSSKKSE